MTYGHWQLAAILFALTCLPVVAWGQPGPDHSHDEDHAHAIDADEEFLRHTNDGAPHRQSMAMWYYNSLGIFYSLLIPLAGLISFVLTLVVVIRGGRYAGAALLFIVPIPLLIGAYAAITGMIMSFQVIASSATSPKPSEIAQGWSMALVAPLVGFWMMAPAFLVAAGGLCIRTMTSERTEKSST